MSKKIKTYGFTLIELLVVIAIIGVLASIVLVSLGGARAKASASKAKSDLSQIMTAIELYQSDNVDVAGIGVGTCANATTDTLADAVSFGSDTGAVTTRHFAAGNTAGDDLCYDQSIATIAAGSGWTPMPAVTGTTYLQAIPRPPANYDYEISAPGTATSYSIQAAGFTDDATAEFICINGSCYCDVGNMCQR